MKIIDAIDRFQRRHPVLAFPLAVIYKYFDDQGPYLAAIISYYAFIACSRCCSSPRPSSASCCRVTPSCATGCSTRR